jgi:hypothetical protein
MIERPDPHAHGDAGALEGCCDLARPGMAADNEHKPATRSGHPQPPSDGRGGEPVDHDRAEDRHEHDRENLVRAGNSVLRQLRTERRRRCSGNDAPGRHPGDECPLVPRKGGAQRRQRHGGGPDDQDHDGDKHERVRQHRSHFVGGDGCRDEHEQHPDEQLDERLLELEEREADVDAPLIAHGDSQQDGRQQAGVLADQVGGYHSGHHDHQRGRDDHSGLVSMDLAEQQPQRRCADRGHQRADAEVDQHLAGLPALAGAHSCEHEHAEQRADRVDERTLPFQEGTDVPRRADEGEQRQDDGRAGHDEDRPDEKCHATVHVVVEQRDRRRRREPREECTANDQAHHRLADPRNDLLERQP